MMGQSGAASMPGGAIAGAASAHRPLAPRDAAATAKAAHDFEAMTLDQMLQPMFATVQSDPLFGGGEAEKTLAPMLVTEMAKLMEARGGLGLAQSIDAKMTEMQEGKR